MILWSDVSTTFAGTIFARGGDASAATAASSKSSGHQLAFAGTVDTAAPNGMAGTLLLDPYNVIISDGAGGSPSGGTFTANANNSVLNVASLQGALASNNVIVTTTNPAGSQAGNITVAAPITWTGATTLTLHADNDIAINAAINAANGGLTLDARGAITATGAVNVATFILQNGAWSQISSSLPAFAAHDFQIHGGSFLRALGGNGGSQPYQIADVYGLQGIGSSPSLLNKNYVLANDVDATGTANWNAGAGFVPIGDGGSSFVGTFDGQNHSIAGLTIASAAARVGLFGVNHGTIENVNVTNANIHATGNSQFVGILAGGNTGTITNTSVTGSVGNSATASIQSAIGAYGGLVGLNDTGGTISRSYATAAVHVAGPRTGYLDGGGLVGQNRGTVRQSYADGAVTATYSSVEFTYLGGLVGWNLGGRVEQSYATTSVTGNGAFGRLGGLVGVNDGGTITQTFASGLITMTGPSSIAGGLLATNNGTVSSSYWDKDTTGQATSAAGTGLTTAQALQQSSYVGWDFSANGAWFMIDGETRPFLRSEWSSTITNDHQLQLVAMNLGASYTLANGINLAPAMSNPSDMWGTSGFAPIGSVSAPFVGQLNGQGYAIDGAVIAPTVSGVTNVGLFAAIGAGGVVSNLNLVNFTVTANANASGPGQFVGTLAGSNAGTITNVTATGTVNGGNLAGVIAGGLVGQNGIFGPGGHAGTITNSSAIVAVTVGDGCFGDCYGGATIAGGLVGSNAFGSISGSHASGAVTGGAMTFVGGLVGQNGVTIPQQVGPPVASIGTITASYAEGAVTINGLRSAAGGLVGANFEGSTITNSQAFGAVTSTANGSKQDEFTSVGGLVGQNSGTITSTTTPVLASACAAGASFSCATGDVSVGSHGSGGGLVGMNDGTIEKSFATGAVTGAAGFGQDGTTHLGGLAGNNNGTITNSHARGDVGGVDVAFLGAGGLVGDSSGLISNSFATGNVTAGSNSNAGGLVGGNDMCGQCGAFGTGANNTATISNSWASGAVLVGSGSLAGGLAASNGGTITNATASGAVTGGANSILGGLVGVSGFDDNNAGGSITGSSASGKVTSLGANSIVGGLIGANAGSIVSSFASGAVEGTSDSYLGGLAGMNFGRIEGSHTEATATVTALGTFNVVGGLVGANAGTIVTSTAAGKVSAGDNSAAGGLVGVNYTLAGIPEGFSIPNSLFPVGSIASSSASGDVTGGAGSYVGGLVGINGGSITNATTSGAVAGGDNATVGELVGINRGPMNVPGLPSIVSTCDNEACTAIFGATISSGPGSIAGSSSTGTVSGGLASYVGGLVGDNPGSVTNSFHTTGAVSGNSALAIGGLVGWNDVGGTITATSPGATYVTAAVTNSGSGFVGGFAGINFGSITKSYATGNVSNTGGADAAYLGGFVGFNAGIINQTYAKGSVTGGDGSILGGFVAVNFGVTDSLPGFISQSYALGPVTGSNNVVAAAFAALNLGTLDQTYAVGLVTGGSNSTLGGLVALSTFGFTPPALGGAGSTAQGPVVTDGAPSTSFTLTGVATNSYWDRQTTGQDTSAGGAPLDTAVFIAGLPAGFDANVWTRPSYPQLVALGAQDTPPGVPRAAAAGSGIDPAAERQPAAVRQPAHQQQHAHPAADPRRSQY